MLALTASMFVGVSSIGAAGIPNPDQVFVATIGTPETVDPAWAYDTASGEIIQNIYDPLLFFNNTSTDQFLAGIADDWPGYGVNPGNAITPSPPAIAGAHETWYFHIRTGVQWQNSSYGTVTPADVEYTFERAMLFDRTGGPIWMFYEPLANAESSYDFAEKNGTMTLADYNTLYSVISNAIESNASWVWFNLAVGYAPFQQILAQTWSMIMSKQWCIDNGLWQGANNYADFLRCWDPAPPGPLMNPAKAMGSGPYSLEAMDEDPHTGSFTLKKFDSYWQGWGANYVTRVTTKSVEEWANRKAQFFSTDPNLQVDFCVVNRANVPELHVDGNKDSATLSGFRLYRPSLPSPTLDAFYYNYEISPTSAYLPLVGSTANRFLLKDRNMRLALTYLFNFTQYIDDVFLGEATQSPVCMPPGTRYYNTSKPMYEIDYTKAQAHLDLALGGTVKAQGLTMSLVYNIGNTARETACKMMADGLQNHLTWGAGAVVNVQAVGLPWATYLPALNAKALPLFSVGWLADFPDPHNWFTPFMSPTAGTYATRQNVTYGLDAATMNWELNDFGPVPYTNYKGDLVTVINNSYVAGLISTGVQIPDANPQRNLLYDELMDIYHAECSQLPTVSALPRHYERTWIHGWIGTFNENPIAPGRYYYTIYKQATATVYEADISAVDTIANTTLAYPVIQVFHGEMRMNGNPAMINYSITVTRKDTTGPATVFIYIAFRRALADGTYYFPLSFYKSLGPWSGSGPYPSYTTTVTWYEDGTGEIGMSVGTWNLSLYASPSGVAAGEIVDSNLGNNLASDPNLVQAKSLTADINGDGVVDIFDAIAFAGAFGATTGATTWNPDCDFVPDFGVIDIFDAIVLAGNFGGHVP
jgi:peptide/nickel transport system substrate-binding protein